MFWLCNDPPLLTPGSALAIVVPSKLAKHAAGGIARSGVPGGGGDGARRAVLIAHPLCSNQQGTQTPEQDETQQQESRARRQPTICPPELSRSSTLALTKALDESAGKRLELFFRRCKQPVDARLNVAGGVALRALVQMLFEYACLELG